MPRFSPASLTVALMYSSPVTLTVSSALTVFLPTVALASCKVQPFWSVLMLPSLVVTLVFKPSMAVVFVVTLFLNASAKPTVTVGASSAPPTVTTVSSSLPRYLIVLFESFFRLTAFVVSAFALSLPATLNFAEILVTASPPLLILVTTSLVMCSANFSLSTPYLMVAPSLVTLSPCAAFSTSKVTASPFLISCGVVSSFTFSFHELMTPSGPSVMPRSFFSWLMFSE